MGAHKDTLPHRQLQHVVADHLRTAILDGELKPGDWLRQKQIAEELGVSPMPVREALTKLSAEGVVEHVPYRGARVAILTTDDVADLYANRALLESMAAAAAAETITPEELAELRDLQSQMRGELTSERLSEYSRLNRRFHRVLLGLPSGSQLGSGPGAGHLPPMKSQPGTRDWKGSGRGPVRCASRRGPPHRYPQMNEVLQRGC